MKTYRFWQVDAFSHEPYMGNPAAIVFEADPLSAEQMQTIARQMNLSETVFLCQPTGPQADYRAKIFTPGREMPFAGHPTIASAFAHSTTHEQPAGCDISLYQECGAGIIPVNVDPDNGPLFTLVAASRPSIVSGLEARELASMLGCSPADLSDDPASVCSIGLPWLIARIRTLSALQAARPDLGVIERICRELGAVGLTVYSMGAVLPECGLHVRTFAPGAGIAEDPVCGSGNGAVAVHVAEHSYRERIAFSYRAEQGLEIHRRGILHLSVDRGDDGTELEIGLGGRAVKVMEGQLWI